MSGNDGLAEWLHEALEPMGRVAVRKMFGGAGAYVDGLIFGILADGELWIKADAESDPVFDAAGLPRFAYDFGDKKGSMNYRRAPADVYDDPQALREWVRLGLEASARAPKKKKKRRAQVRNVRRPTKATPS